MRAKIRQALRALLRLPFEDHPSITAANNEPHRCATQAVDLVSFLRALHRASLFPVPEDDSTICLMWLGERLRAVKQDLLPVEACAECDFVGNHWSTQLDEIGSRNEYSPSGLNEGLESALAC